MIWPQKTFSTIYSKNRLKINHKIRKKYQADFTIWLWKYQIWNRNCKNRMRYYKLILACITMPTPLVQKTKVIRLFLSHNKISIMKYVFKLRKSKYQEIVWSWCNLRIIIHHPFCWKNTNQRRKTFSLCWKVIVGLKVKKDEINKIIKNIGEK